MGSAERVIAGLIASNACRWQRKKSKAEVHEEVDAGEALS